MALRKTINVEERVKSKNILISDETEEVFMGMAMDRASIANITNLLTDMYTNPVEATVREVVSNAIDASVRGGSTKAIEISTPSILAPNFIVKDFGTGMSKDEVRSVYSQYGASTKGDDYSQIGAFGLGAKAPLAYCTEYSVETTKDGVTTYFTVGRKQLGNFVRVISSKKTGRENGTTVTVPARVEDSHLFFNAIQNYKKYPLDVPVIVDGDESSASDDLIYLFDQELDVEGVTGRIWVNSEDVENLIESKALFGNYSLNLQVSYLLSGWNYDNPQISHSYWGSRNSIRIVSELKPGVVDYTTSRDAIVANDRSESLFLGISKAIEEYNSQKIYDAVMEFYRNAKTLTKLAMLRVFAYWDVFADVSEGETEWVVNTKSGSRIKMSLKDFEDSDGENLLLLFYPAFRKFKNDANATMIISRRWNSSKYVSADSLKEARGFETFLRSSSSRSADLRVSEYNSLIRNAFAENKQNISIARAISSVIIEGSGRKDRDSARFLVVTDITEDNVSKILRLRNMLTNNGYENSLIFLTSSSKDDIDLEGLDKLANVQVETLEEIVARFKEIRKSASKSSKTKTVANTVDFYKLLNPKDAEFDSNNFWFNSLPCETLSLDEVIARGVTVYLGRLFLDEVSQTVYGAVNEGVDLGEALYIPRVDNPFMASDFTKLKNYGKVIASRRFSYNSKDAKEIASTKSYFGSYLNEKLDAVPIDLLRSTYAARLLYGQPEKLLKVLTLDEDIPVNFAENYEASAWGHILNYAHRVESAIVRRDPTFIRCMTAIDSVIREVLKARYFINDPSIVNAVVGLAIERMTTEEIIEHDYLKPFVADVSAQINEAWRAAKNAEPEEVTGV